MILGIMCATENELRPLINKLEGKEVIDYIARQFYTGTINGMEIVAVMGGVGKVNGAVTAQALIEKFKIEKLIFTGVAGGLDPKVKIGDIVIGTRLVCHDIPMDLINNNGNTYDGMPMDGFASDPQLVEICKNSGDNLHFGTIITGDQFITDKEREGLIARFDALCVDMESAAVAQVCWFYKMPLLIIRGLSDTADDGAFETYEENIAASSVAALGLVAKVIASLK